MISVKVCKREDGSISNVSCTGHANADVQAAVFALVESCGKQLEAMKSAKMSINESGMCFIDDMRKSKPALAVIDTLVNGLENLARRNKYSVQIMWLFEK